MEEEIDLDADRETFREISWKWGKHALMSPLYLLMAICAAPLMFLGWAGKDVHMRSNRAALMAITIPALIGWVCIAIQFTGVFNFGSWAGWILAIIYTLVAVYALLSLDRMEALIQVYFPKASPAKRKWLERGLIVLNLPILLIFMGGVSSAGE